MSASAIGYLPPQVRHRDDARQKKVDGRVKHEGHSDDQTDHPDGRRYPCLGRFVAKSPDVIDVDRGETRIWPRRRHEEVADEDEGRGQSGPGGKCTPVVSELPGQITAVRLIVEEIQLVRGYRN